MPTVAELQARIRELEAKLKLLSGKARPTVIKEPPKLKAARTMRRTAGRVEGRAEEEQRARGRTALQRVRRRRG